MLRVLGSNGEDIISSGDEVADAESRARFTTAWDAKHSVRPDGDKNAVVILGNDDFPFPIPLIKKKAGWEFDTAAGRLEILYRRIGRNELDAIQTCLAYVDAQNEYAEKDRGEGAGVYAQRIVSASGKKDGLYWPGEDSPLGELAAQASAEGYKVGAGPIPYHGYYYRILTQQGPNAPGGTLSYVVKGKMIGGFALIRVSGRIRQLRRHDFPRQSQRSCLPEGSRRLHYDARQADELVRSRSDLEEGRYVLEVNRGGTIKGLLEAHRVRGRASALFKRRRQSARAIRPVAARADA